LDVHEVELDLDAHVRVFDSEITLAEHPGEHVQTPPDLGAVERTVLTTELTRLDILSHVFTLGRGGVLGSECEPAIG